MSGISEASSVGSYEGFFPEEEKETPLIEREVQLKTYAKGQADIQPCLSPNMQSLLRKENIRQMIAKEKDDIKLFELYGELFKVQAEEFKREGGLVEDLRDPDFKHELKETYNLLCDFAGKQSLAIPFHNLYIRLYELELEAWCNIRGEDLLKAQAEQYRSLLVDVLMEEKRATPKINEFYWEIMAKGYLSILERLEQLGRKDLLQTITWNVYFYYFRLVSYKLFPVKEGEFDPLDHFFSYLAKYANEYYIRDYFCERFKELEDWDREYQWIALRCRAAEIKGAMGKIRGDACLDLAKMDVEKNMWCYFFSPDRQKWNEAKEKALALIEETREKLSAFDNQETTS